jgi:hypothetical protein
MAPATAEAIATSDLADDRALSFDFDLNIDAVELTRIMRRIGTESNESVIQLSAFDSPI